MLASQLIRQHLTPRVRMHDKAGNLVHSNMVVNQQACQHVHPKPCHHHLPCTTHTIIDVLAELLLGGIPESWEQESSIASV